MATNFLHKFFELVKKWGRGGTALKKVLRRRNNKESAWRLTVVLCVIHCVCC